MANDFKNTSLVTKFAVKAFLNALMMGQKVDRQLDEKSIFAGKIGASASVRRPVMFEAVDGVTLSASDIEEATVSVALDNRKHVGFLVTSEDLALKIEDANERYIIPAMEELAQQVESAIAAEYTEIPNFVGTPGTTPSTFLDVANAGAELSKLGVPMDMRSAFYDSKASVSLANGLKGVFVQGTAKTAIEEASIGRYGKFDIFESNSLKSHTVGAATGTILVDDAGTIEVTYATAKGTDTQTLNLDGVASTSGSAAFKAGDVFTLAGVNSVNRRTREDTGDLQTFVVTTDSIASTGTTDNIPVTIAPPIIISGAYQTVTAAPADDAVVTLKSGTAGSSYRQNMAFHKNAITLAFGQLDVVTDGASGSRQNYKGVSIKTQRQYAIGADTLTYRFDVLFGVKVQNRSFAVRTTG